MKHHVKTRVEIPDVLLKHLVRLGWLDHTHLHETDPNYQVVLYAAPDGSAGLYIDEQGALDYEGDEILTYNLMVGDPQPLENAEDWLWGWDDEIHDNDLDPVLAWFAAR